MPNHIINMIAVDGDPKRINEMREAIQNDECGLGTIDFNKIIPMPPSMDIECVTRTDRDVKPSAIFSKFTASRIPVKRTYPKYRSRTKNRSFVPGQTLIVRIGSLANKRI